MKVLQTNSAQLSNYEVLQIILEPIGSHLTKVKDFQEYRTALHTTKQFLKQEMMPCSVQTAEQIQAMLEYLKPFALTKSEKLMIINTRPTNLIELVVLIEDAETRFTPEKLQEILDQLDQHLPFTRPVQEE